MLSDFVFEHFLYFVVCTTKLKSLKSGLVIASKDFETLSFHPKWVYWIVTFLVFT